LRMGISSKMWLAGCHSAHEGNLNATCEQPRHKSGGFASLYR
jgi:hypothetical protein